MEYKPEILGAALGALGGGLYTRYGLGRKGVGSIATGSAIGGGIGLAAGTGISSAMASNNELAPGARTYGPEVAGALGGAGLGALATGYVMGSDAPADLMAGAGVGGAAGLYAGSLLGDRIRTGIKDARAAKIKKAEDAKQLKQTNKEALSGTSVSSAASHIGVPDDYALLFQNTGNAGMYGGGAGFIAGAGHKMGMDYFVPGIGNKTSYMDAEYTNLDNVGKKMGDKSSSGFWGEYSPTARAQRAADLASGNTGVGGTTSTKRQEAFIGGLSNTLDSANKGVFSMDSGKEMSAKLSGINPPGSGSMSKIQQAADTGRDTINAVKASSDANIDQLERSGLDAKSVADLRATQATTIKQYQQIIMDNQTGQASTIKQEPKDALIEAHKAATEKLIRQKVAGVPSIGRTKGIEAFKSGLSTGAKTGGTFMLVQSILNGLQGAGSANPPEAIPR